MRVYNTALEQTRDNVKAFAKTNTQFIQNQVIAKIEKEILATTTTISPKDN